jgi:hypothetical protein
MYTVKKVHCSRIDTTEFADHVRSYNTMPPFNFSSVMFPLAKVIADKMFSGFQVPTKFKRFFIQEIF